MGRSISILVLDVLLLPCHVPTLIPRMSTGHSSQPGKISAISPSLLTLCYPYASTLTPKPSMNGHNLKENNTKSFSIQTLFFLLSGIIPINCDQNLVNWTTYEQVMVFWTPELAAALRATIQFHGTNGAIDKIMISKIQNIYFQSHLIVN